MNRKGFTLIELLGVIVLLSILMSISIFKIINSVKSTSNKIDEMTKNLIYNATDLYLKKNNTLYAKRNLNRYCIPLETLVDEGYLKSPLNFSHSNVDMTSLKSVEVECNDKYNYQIVDNETCSAVEISPNLHSGMTPIRYNGTNWLVTNKDDLRWFDYKNQNWANAVVLKSGITKKDGDIVNPSSDITAMFVWIPKYEYKIRGTYGTNVDGTAGTQSLPGAIDIKFITKAKQSSTNGYIIHPAFKLGSEPLSGIWVGKFETTGTTTLPTILPGVASINTKSVSVFFTASQLFNNYITDADSHMMKNVEWSAVTYLSQSIYGKYGNNLYTGANKEIYQNKSSITGNSNGTPAQETTNTQCPYNDVTIASTGTGYCGGGASTTGNITGIYDMVGLGYEYVMAVLVDSNGTVRSGKDSTNNSGYTGLLSDGTSYTGTTLPNPKYYDTYKSQTVCNNGTCYGHMHPEVSGWYGDWYSFLSNDSPWMIHGSAYYGKQSGGIFDQSQDSGTGRWYASFRVVLK